MDDILVSLVVILLIDYRQLSTDIKTKKYKIKTIYDIWKFWL